MAGVLAWSSLARPSLCKEKQLESGLEAPAFEVGVGGVWVPPLSVLWEAGHTASHCKLQLMRAVSNAFTALKNK